MSRRGVPEQRAHVTRHQFRRGWRLWRERRYAFLVDGEGVVRLVYGHTTDGLPESWLTPGTQVLLSRPLTEHTPRSLPLSVARVYWLADYCTQQAEDVHRKVTVIRDLQRQHENLTRSPHIDPTREDHP